MLPKIKKILYATGMGPGAPHVFRYALAMASQHDAQIIAVSAIEPLPAFAQSLVELHISHQDAEQRQLEARNQAELRRVAAIKPDGLNGWLPALPDKIFLKPQRPLIGFQHRLHPVICHREKCVLYVVGSTQHARHNR